MDDRGVISHGRAHVHHRRQQFILHLDQVYGQFRIVRAVRGHRGQGMPVIQDLVFCHAVLRHLAHVEHAGRARVDQFMLDSGEVGAGDHRAHARKGFCGAGVDGDDARMGVRAAQYFTVQHVRQVKVIGEARLSGNLVQPVRAYRRGANHVKTVILRRFSHRYASAVLSAAFNTDRTSLS